MDKLKQFLSGRSKWTRIPNEVDEDFKLISRSETESENVQPRQHLQSTTPPMKAKENVLNFTSLKPSKKVPSSSSSKTNKLIDDEVPLINL